MTPEERAVIEAAKTCRAQWRAESAESFAYRHERDLVAAVDALRESEKPWRVQAPYSISGQGHSFSVWDKSLAVRICALLNESEARK